MTPRGFVLPSLATLGSAWLRGLVPKGNALARGTAKDPLNEKLWLLTGHFGDLCQGQAGKRGIATLAGVTEPDHQERGGGLLLHRGGQEEYVWNSGDSCGHLRYSLVPL